MKSIRLTCVILFCVNTIAWANDTINTWIGTEFPQAQVGFIAINAETGATALSYNADKLFTPASTLKLLTSYTALSKFGPHYRFDTTLYYDAKAAVSRQYHGDIGLKFTGDPSFTDNDLLNMFKEFSHSTITGDIIIDDTTLSKPYYGRGWAYDSLSWSYSAPISSIIINENTFYVTLNGSKQSGATLKASAPLSGIHVTSDVVSQPFKTTESICQINAEIDDENNVHLYGCWPTGSGAQSLNLAIANPHIWAQYQIKRVLNTLNIQLQGSIKFASIPKKLNTTYVHQSPPLSELLEPVLMHSNNLYAEALAKTIGHHIYQRGTFQAGSQAIERFVKEHLQVNSRQLEMFDGSGLSSHNLISPKVMGAVLLDIYKTPQLSEYIFPILPRWGVSGTLHWRGSQKDLDFIGKTGGMTYHSSLAGYLKQHGHTYVVVIMINEINQEVHPIKAKESAVLRLISQNIP